MGVDQCMSVGWAGGGLGDRGVESRDGRLTILLYSCEQKQFKVSHV